MVLQDLLSRIPDIKLQGNPSVTIRGITCDSREVEEGFLFVAIRGEKTEGVRFVQQAIEKGAAAIAAQESVELDSAKAFLEVPDARRFLAQSSLIFFGDPASRMKLVAITGTNGKTTTSYLIDSICQSAGLRSCLAGTIGMKIGDRLFPAQYTTPEAPALLLFLREALFAGCTHGVLEVSSHALAQKRVLGLKFGVGVFTNLTADHLDFHGNMESYFRAKRLLFSAEGQNGVEAAVINTDDPYGRRLAAEISCAALTFGFGPASDIRTTERRNCADGMDLEIATPGGSFTVRTSLAGSPNIYNIMAAVGASIRLGIDTKAIRQGIESLTAVSGRMEHVRAGQPYTVIVDYAHTPDALEKLLETVEELPQRRKIITVFGCGGDRDRTKRPLMGRIAARKSDLVIATSDNPRTEDPTAILAEIEPGLRKGPAEYRTIADRREAIRAALCMAGEGDVVVIAGKGHENRQIIGERSFAFDDRTIARDLIIEMHHPSRSARLK